MTGRDDLRERLDALEPDDSWMPDVMIAYRTSEGWVDSDGNPVPEGADVAIRYGGVTMERSEAEAEGYEILEATESENNPEADLVIVPWDYGDMEGPGT